MPKKQASNIHLINILGFVAGLVQSCQLQDLEKLSAFYPNQSSLYNDFKTCWVSSPNFPPTIFATATADLTVTPISLTSVPVSRTNTTLHVGEGTAGKG